MKPKRCVRKKRATASRNSSAPAAVTIQGAHAMFRDIDSSEFTAYSSTRCCFRTEVWRHDVLKIIMLRVIERSGEPPRTRTWNPLIKSCHFTRNQALTAIATNCRELRQTAVG